MRFFTFIAACLLSFTFVTGQQVSRDKVIVEVATGTWCQYCPAAANGVDQLYENGYEVGVIEYHGGDDYQNSYSSSRINYYGVNGYPTAYFDGILSFVGGGGASQSNYAQYLSKYNQRINIPSSFTIGFDGSNSGFTDYEITVTVNKVASVTSTNMVLHFVLTESEIPEYWQGMSELNFVERLMRPNQNGTSLDFSSSNTQEVNINFSLMQGWVPEHCQVVAFVQDVSTKEVLQGAVRDLSEFETSNNYDACLKEISQVPVMMCENSFSPKVKIINYGLETLTSMDIVYQVNSQASETMNWTGNLAYLEETEVQLDPVDVEVYATNIFSVTLENPNGQPDQFPQNNNLNFDFDEAPVEEAPIYLIMKTDENPEETTWELTDYDGNVLYSGGPYTQPNQNVIELLELTGSIGCYHFKIYDSGGDGLTGSGICKLADANQQFFAQGKAYGSGMEVQFVSGTTGMHEPSLPEGVAINPNPFSESLTIDPQGEYSGDMIVKIYDLGGRLVFSCREKTESGAPVALDLNKLDAGVYTLSVETGQQHSTSRIIKL